jgi:quinol monooxygenase YgiN
VGPAFIYRRQGKVPYPRAGEHRRVVTENGEPIGRGGIQMIAVIVKFEVKDEVAKELADASVAREHIQQVVEGCRKIPGLKEKYFIMDPRTAAQGAMLIWEKQEDFDAYLKSPEYKATVLDICKGKPSIETYIHTANLTDGVLI